MTNNFINKFIKIVSLPLQIIDDQKGGIEDKRQIVPLEV